MKSLKILLLFILTALSAAAQTEITAIVILTNIPAGLTTNVTINADTRTWTNNPSASLATLIQTTNSIGQSKTNLLLQLANYPVLGPMSVAYNATNTAGINITAPDTTNLTVVFGGNWATVTYITNTFAVARPILAPTNAMSFAVRTNALNAIVNLLSAIPSTNAIPLATRAFSNYVDLATAQLVLAKTLSNSTFWSGAAYYLTNVSGTNMAITNVIAYLATISGGLYSGTVSNLTNGTIWATISDGGRITNAIAISGTIRAITNGYWTNGIIDNASLSNGVNYGAGFSSPGTGGNSQQFGVNSIATGNNSLAVGQAQATARSALALGNATAAGNFDVAIGDGSAAIAGSGVALGVSAVVQGTNGVAIGYNAIVGVNHTNSIAFGANSTTTSKDQIVFGASTHTVTLPGVLAISGSQTNTTFTGTNVFNGRIDWKSRANSGLANGNNAAVLLGTNVYVRLSGASTIGAINGFAAEQDGSWHIVEISGAITNIISNQSGSDPTPANRIVTGTGADIPFTNSPTVIQVIYNATDARWKLVTLSR